MLNKIKKGCLYLAGCCMVQLVHAQQKPPTNTREFTFTTENDAYLFQKKDAYYTNGFALTLRSAGEKKGVRVMHTYELGQKIYTPLLRKTTGPQDIDRPYCGYLYAQYTQTRFPVGDAILQYGATVGQVGPYSLGENVQSSYHKMLGYARFTGWQYQVQNSLGADLGIRYARTVLQDSSLFKWVPVAEASLGSNFTYARLGAYLCIGVFEKNQQSALWNARIQKKGSRRERSYELFTYWYPQVLVQGYNVTVQGGLFSKGSGAVLAEPKRVMFQQQFGLYYASGKISANLALVIQSREANTQINLQRYGSVQLSYRFH
ncbi:MAG: lipid A deacylase LpxR family protein [Bacteroidetes bacterium]|nr:lipid A deacylase LpxR family protein [Bacteroidota bacterium]